jgi:hypothetical protein
VRRWGDPSLHSLKEVSTLFLRWFVGSLSGRFPLFLRFLCLVYHFQGPGAAVPVGSLVPFSIPASSFLRLISLQLIDLAFSYFCLKDKAFSCNAVL